MNRPAEKPLPVIPLPDGRVLTPTGRGSFVFVDEFSLDEILERWDRVHGPGFVKDARSDVIDAYHRAKALSEEARKSQGAG